MRKAVIAFLLTASSGYLNAQVLQKPSGQPGKVNLPVPKIQPLTPADLLITDISLVSAVMKTDTKLILVTVRITVKNAGQTASPASILGASAKGQPQGSIWVDAGNTVPLQALNGAQVCSKEVTFKLPAASITERQFNFRVLADAGARVQESNENNNYSQGILIGL